MSSDDISVSLAKKCMEFIYQVEFEDIRDVKNEDDRKSVDLVSNMTGDLLYEVEVKTGKNREITDTEAAAKKLSGVSDTLEYRWYVWTDESIDRRRNHKLRDIKKKLIPLLQSLEKKNISEVSSILGYEVDGVNYGIDPKRLFFDRNISDIRELVVNDNGIIIDEDAYKVCELLRTSAGVVTAFPQRNSAGGIKFQISSSCTDAVDMDSYIEYIIVGLETNVQDYKDIPDKYNETTLKSLFVIADMMTPGTLGMLCYVAQDSLPTRAPRIDESIDEFIVLNTVRRNLLVWRKNVGWSTADVGSVLKKSASFN